MTSLSRAIPILAAVTLLLGSAGCAKHREAQRQRHQQEQKQAAQQELNKKSEALWEESSRRKNTRMSDETDGGDLQVGDKVLHLSSLRLRLGPLKTPGDLHGGQNPSELDGHAEGGASLSIGNVAVSAAIHPEQVTGQTHEISPEETTEIVMSDGSRWRFKDGGINFLQSERPKIRLVIEGHAIPVSNPKAVPVRVSGELVANVELLPARAAQGNPKP